MPPLDFVYFTLFRSVTYFLGGWEGEKNNHYRNMLKRRRISIKGTRNFFQKFFIKNHLSARQLIELPEAFRLVRTAIISDIIFFTLGAAHYNNRVYLILYFSLNYLLL